MKNESNQEGPKIKYEQPLRNPESVLDVMPSPLAKVNNKDEKDDVMTTVKHQKDKL